MVRHDLPKDNNHTETAWLERRESMYIIVARAGRFDDLRGRC